LVVENGSQSLVDDFYQVFARNMRDLGTPVYSRRLFTETLRVFEDRARLHVVRHDGRAIAGAVTIRFRDTVIVPWASSLREFRHLCPNMLLYWAMLERATTDGLRLFDFGRSTRGAGTHSFKQQWGAREIPIHWEYVLLKRADAPDHGLEGSRFDAAIAAWQRLPVWLTNRVGPRIVRNIP
jgi:FemAB-related protein (PEP-CTERM system-associated)